MNLPNMDLADFQMLAALTNAAAAAQQQQQAAAVSNKAAACIKFKKDQIILATGRGSFWQISGVFRFFQKVPPLKS